MSCLNEAQVDFLDLFLLGCLLKESPRIGDAECERLDDNYIDVVSRGREADLRLHTCDQSLALEDASRQALDDLEPLAELLDSWQGGRVYRNALKAQRAKLDDPSAIPSQRVMDAMTASGQGHCEWVMAQSLQHQQELRSHGPDAATFAGLERMSADSLAEQAALEAEPQPDFATFLADYLKS